jgi:hypothetical protein
MTKRKRKSTLRKPAVANSHRKRAASSPRRPGGWQDALERNLRAEGYSAREARELVEIAAS